MDLGKLTRVNNMLQLPTFDSRELGGALSSVQEAVPVIEALVVWLEQPCRHLRPPCFSPNSLLLLDSRSEASPYCKTEGSHHDCLSRMHLEIRGYFASHPLFLSAPTFDKKLSSTTRFPHGVT
jgi:hypothetical protein